MKIVVLTTSYPRYEGDPTVHFLGEAVAKLRERGLDVEVVSPMSFQHFGIAYGAGVMGNLRREPWRTAFVPVMLRNFRAAARGHARDADLLHAHWLPTGLVAASLGKPFVLTVHGTDAELARRAPPLARWVLRKARLVICVSNALADVVRGLGLEHVRVIPNGVEIPPFVREPVSPPEVLFAGRLSREKGILELVEAAREMNLVVAGDGPLRPQVPGALGFLPHRELGELYERAAVVACPSHREGFNVVCAEAMAYGRPVAAGAVGGLLDLVVDEETGLLVPPRDVAALRAALERLLGDVELRKRLGAAARERARTHFSWDRVTDATLAAYDEALMQSR
ncbi:MAG: glycosyltransferase family 4 protein [Actinobacteria bacterium]|nr:MAG: glycosyltransferase family 4 protein [Actinomycetota bacterium]